MGTHVFEKRLGEERVMKLLCDGEQRALFVEDALGYKKTEVAKVAFQMGI